jgi:hypothetical protein
MPFTFLALMPKKYRLFVFHWIMPATVIRAGFGIAETKGLVVFPAYGGEAILAATFVFAFILLARTPAQSEDT